MGNASVNHFFPEKTLSGELKTASVMGSPWGIWGKLSNNEHNNINRGTNGIFLGNSWGNRKTTYHTNYFARAKFLRNERREWNPRIPYLIF
jgi:hypothetical protein